MVVVEFDGASSLMFHFLFLFFFSKSLLIFDCTFLILHLAHSKISTHNRFNATQVGRGIALLTRSRLLHILRRGKRGGGTNFQRRENLKQDSNTCATQ